MYLDNVKVGDRLYNTTFASGGTVVEMDEHVVYVAWDNLKLTNSNRLSYPLRVNTPNVILPPETAKEKKYPDGNPKTAEGAKKLPLHLVPPSAAHYLAQAFADGAAKYGPYNWREAGVAASVYYAAMKRHQDAWWDGENLSTDAKVHHLAHTMACCAIVLDALTVGKLIDDRPPKGAAAEMQDRWVKEKASASTCGL